MCDWDLSHHQGVGIFLSHLNSSLSMHIYIYISECFSILFGRHFSFVPRSYVLSP